MTLIEAVGGLIKRAVHGMDDRSADTVGHRQRGEARVVVHDVERLAKLGGEVDLVPRGGDMV